MAIVPIKTASTTGYCDCIHGCYELASLRDEETGKGLLPPLQQRAPGNESRHWTSGPCSGQDFGQHSEAFGASIDSGECRSAGPPAR